MRYFTCSRPHLVSVRLLIQAQALLRGSKRKSDKSSDIFYLGFRVQGLGPVRLLIRDQALLHNANLITALRDTRQTAHSSFRLRLLELPA